jgi:predicted lipoprotein with Yx(FWY)xxD motif
MLKATAIAAALTLITVVAVAASTPPPAAPANGVLATPAGATLYTFDKDAANSGKSTCNAQCATNWPPLAAQPSDAAAGDFSIVTRDDGSKQWAFKGWPLYTFAKDAKAGDTTGDGKGNVWHVVKG